MERNEAKAKRKKLGLQERKLTEKHCDMCPNKGQDVSACGGCPIFSKITNIGKKYITVTRQYRKANRIKEIDNSIIEPVKPRSKSVAGLAWDEWKQIAQAHSISRSLFNARMKTGMSPQTAATKPLQNRRFTNEQIYTALSNGLSYVTIINRVKRGWSVEDAITVPAQKRTR